MKTKNPTSTIACTGGTLAWTSGFAYVTEIKFEAEGECQIEGQSDVHKKFGAATPQKVDLFAPFTSVGSITVPPCDYRNSKFEFALSPGAGNPALELKGNYNSTPVIFKINSVVELDGLGEIDQFPVEQIIQLLLH